MTMKILQSVTKSIKFIFLLLKIQNNFKLKKCFLDKIQSFIDSLAKLFFDKNFCHLTSVFSNFERLNKKLIKHPN